jgi:formate hydrogenlyase subunit 3/multisubunit Na+/H+ antiporter MnhD subunit
MTVELLILLILIPLIAGILTFILPKPVRGICALLATGADFIIAVLIFNKEINFSMPWAGFGMDFSLRLYQFSGFILLAATFFGLLLAIYSLSFLKDKGYEKQFYAYILISIAFINGALLANNLVVFLFFWEGLLLTLFGLIYIGGKQAFKTALKALVIVGVGDFCMMAGIILTGHLAGTLTISDIKLPINAMSGLALVLLAIGAMAKGGAMPFHTWIPDAAIDAPLPFMSFFPGAIEKLLGIYFLVRITVDMFKLNPESGLSTFLMIVGSLTIVLAVMMALIQKDYKRLLSFHAISQVGYMILGVGTCVPAGIVGGVFHMLNNSIYKNCLFLTGGAVERQTGTTNLTNLGGLRSRMPVTFICFVITAASISGVPPFNGFFSKELIYDAAIGRHWIFYLAAIVGSFFTAASFLKLGHAAYCGKIHEEHKTVREAPIPMLIPMITLASICVIFGLFNYLPIDNFIKPVAGAHAAEERFSGMPAKMILVVITVLVLIGALIHHLLAAKINGGGVKASEHIHNAPVLSSVYGWAENGNFDLYQIGARIGKGVALTLWSLDRAVDWVYNFLIPVISLVISQAIRRMHTGYYVVYIIWALIGAFVVIMSVLT